MLLDIGYVVDNVDPRYQGEKRLVFLVILAVARIVIWETRNKGLDDSANFSHRDLILFFKHQLRVKMRQKTLGSHNIRQKVCSEPSRTKWGGATSEAFFLPLPTHGDDGLGPQDPIPGK